ncbi:hypothetical protein LBMAG42_06750 [Deltaproteobacteria bacterium]|nr:hypothetical protein LBMAG42_06750 [Deltaproteobacteria bacterium]
MTPVTVASIPAAPTAPARLAVAPPPVALPPGAPTPAPTLETDWLRLLAAIPKAEAVAIHDVAFAIEVTPAGVLRVGVKKELWRHRVREALGQLDLGAVVHGARRVEIVFTPDAGRTGREQLAEVDLGRRAEARAAAEASEPIRKLIQLFGAELEEVTPFRPDDAQEVPVVVDDLPDDYAPGGGMDG